MDTAFALLTLVLTDITTVSTITRTLSIGACPVPRAIVSIASIPYTDNKQILRDLQLSKTVYVTS